MILYDFHTLVKKNVYLLSIFFNIRAVCVGAWFVVTRRCRSAWLYHLAMATMAEKSTKERLLSALADLEVLSR